MSDFLTNLVSRSIDPNSAVRPRLASLYEPLPTADRIMAGALFDPANSGQDEAGDSLLSNSSSLQRQHQPVPDTSPATTAQPSPVASAYQSDESLKTSRDSHRPEEFFFATESAPDKSLPREPGADQPRELSAIDFSAPQPPRSDAVVPAAMIHSAPKENSTSLDLAQSPSSKSPKDKPEANPEYEINKDLRLVLESLVDQTIGEPHNATSTPPPPVAPPQIAASPLSPTEKASRSAPDEVVHAVTIEKVVSAGESAKQFVEVEDEPVADKSVQETASAEEGKQKTSSPAVQPVTIERIVPTKESTPGFVSTVDVSHARPSAQETASDEETQPKASSAVHQVRIERIVPTHASTPRFVANEDVSLTRASVREAASAEEIRPRASSAAVHPVTNERIVPGGRSSQPHFFFAKGSPFVQDLSPARTLVPPPQPPTIVVHPEISQVRPAAETRVDSPAPEPNVQITIGRIEVRAIKAAEVQPKNDRPAQSTLMSLDDYLRQRAQGGKR